ncbi:PIN domain-containing protein [Mobiluncus mulieris]|uniref:PIN domain-containing protein n=1 Tax=Mobiluncus mulieris TaxID=2052 RepID=UPI00030C5EE9|nr:PIN domain-containing protein [Mobiluncus mulieris]NMW60567.1 PIN domain-containing protein [Mobiluncus mulieris]
MTNYLIDANALIAFNISTHQHHNAALRWFAQADTVLVCPIAEGALFRFVVRNHFGFPVAHQLLADFCDIPKVLRIPDDLHYDNADWTGVRGHRQITDVYLVELAQRHRALLATFDQGIAALRPDATFLIH